MGVGFLHRHIPSKIKASLSQVSWQRGWESWLQTETEGLLQEVRIGRKGKKRVLDGLARQCPVRLSSQWNCFWPKLLSSQQMETNSHPQIMWHNLPLLDGSFCQCAVSQGSFYTSIVICFVNHDHFTLVLDFSKKLKLHYNQTASTNTPNA